MLVVVYRTHRQTCVAKRNVFCFHYFPGRYSKFNTCYTAHLYYYALVCNISVVKHHMLYDVLFEFLLMHVQSQDYKAEQWINYLQFRDEKRFISEVDVDLSCQSF